MPNMATKWSYLFTSDGDDEDEKDNNTGSIQYAMKFGECTVK